LVVLVDGVLFTGRTIRAALGAVPTAGPGLWLAVMTASTQAPITDYVSRTCLAATRR
jgi:pyrimidine operon attenuation protein/uracil phosphoribosyltransferase